MQKPRQQQAHPKIEQTKIDTELFELYSDYFLSTFSYVTATNLSKITGGTA